MQQPQATRKRGAPEASPDPLPQQQPFNSNLSSGQDNAMLDSQLVDWINADGSGNLNSQFSGVSGFDTSLYDTSLDNSLGLANGGLTSNQLVRRHPNQQLVSRGNNGWQDLSTSTGQGAWEAMDEGEESLEQRALVAKKEAQAKRKQIPPFVQKLSSFLDDNTNTELIRWSDDGNSFIVLDEDEFARKLIPELFKHNNYASFVRQLNMYGFHKKVGLSDNSMKASENKRKTPSEYFNKYFKRGKPELLWLIQKPKNPPGSKRKREDGKLGGQGDSDEERKYIPSLAEGPTKSSVAADTSTKDLTLIPKAEFTNLKQDLRTLQHQQKMISQVIQKMRRQNEQFFQQATAFQEMHNRHENSINAILTFLATFYNRSLEGQGDFAEMFGNQLPQNNGQHGNIVDMSEYPEVELNMPRPNQMRRSTRQPLLLPAPDAKKDGASPRSPVSVRDSTLSPKPRTASVFPRNSRITTPTPAKATSVPAPSIKTDAETPNLVSDRDDMMNVINAANSASPPTTGPGLDFDSALQHFQNADGNIPLTSQQRTDVLSMMQANMSKGGVGSPNPLAAISHALSQDPPMPAPQMPASIEQLAYLQKLQEVQAAQVQSLADRLQPLSPSGQIPGLYEGSSDPPQDFALDDWLATGDSGGYFPEQPPYNNDAAFDNDLFGYDGEGSHVPQSSGPEAEVTASHGFLSEENARLLAESTGNAGRVESVSSRGASPRSPAVEIESASKRRKVA
ncbi:hypothetical protein E2P81_ATG06598 [Venturia nashicola]|uniref:HSF-type DNA-binding domain-containing protein n=1 Tax=Venturia nashicola TaxID=86259 RepID=A0A4Z1P5A6_9PEZI|nr:hypothetical protein E6O75_ATG06766 [Venturia nashicola]TLD29945.1 hypothetical protein E2P81_ATG06598 [Venturia nashicola]